VLLVFTNKSAGKLVIGNAGILLLCGDQIVAVRKQEDNPVECLIFCRNSLVSRIVGHDTHHRSDPAPTGKTPYTDRDVFLEGNSAEARSGGFMFPVQKKFGGHGRQLTGRRVFAFDMAESYLRVKAERMVR